MKLKKYRDESWFSENEAKRINTLSKEIVATHPLSILDAGCENGMLLNHLQKEKDLKEVRLVGAESCNRPYKD